MTIPCKPGENVITDIKVNFDKLSYVIHYKYRYGDRWSETACPNSADSLGVLFARFIVDMRLLCGTPFDERFDGFSPMMLHD